MWIIDRVKPWLPFKEQAVAPADSPIVADIPIATAELDLLERTNMAKRIAQILAARGGRQGRVFAIRGAWGQGKSSLKFLAIEALGESYPDAMVLDFNPWQWGDNDAIARALFKEMAGKLGGAHAPHAQKRAKALRQYGDALTGGSKAIGTFAKNSDGVAKMLIVLAGACALIGFTFSGLDVKKLAGILAIGATALQALGWLLTWLGKDRSADTLDDVRQDLEKRLDELAFPLVVFVDDIDRLEPEQIRLVVRQIKANASLPNINFVLIFQPSIVEKALDPIANEGGRDYLEKIVQANFDVPPTPDGRLLVLFLDQLRDIIAGLDTVANGMDVTRWGNVMRGGIEPLIRNLRDSRRLLTSIAIHIEMHRGEHAFEVNLIDFIALEALRVFEPKFHAALAANSALLLHNGRVENEGKTEEQIIALLDALPTERMKTCRRLLREIFPTIDWALGGTEYDPQFVTKWTEMKQVCTTPHFARYFELQLSPEEVSESDFHRFLASVEDEAAMVEIVKEFRARKLHTSFASRLERSYKQLPPAYADRLLRVMFDLGEELGGEGENVYNVGFLACWRAAYLFLGELDGSATRRMVFEAAFSQSAPLGVAGFVLSVSEKAITEPKSGSRPLFDVVDIEALIIMWLERMEMHAARLDALIEDTNLIERLFRWQQFGSDEPPRKWAIAQAEAGAIMKLLRRFVVRGTTQTVTDLVATQTVGYERSYFDNYLPVEVVRDALRRLDLGELSDDDRALVDLFNHQSPRWKSDESGSIEVDDERPGRDD